MKHGKNLSLTIICIILGIMLSWQYKSISKNKEVASFENKRAEELKDDLLNEKKNNELLMEQIQKLQEEIEKYQAAQGNIDENIALLTKELENTKLLAGLYDVKGKGIIVTLDSKSTSEFDRITENDILRVLNEMRASDVQAISINDERIIATSEIKEAGGYFIINGRQILPPIVIKAIADPENVEYALTMTGGILKKLEAYLKVDVKKDDNIFIPKVRNVGTVIKTDLLTPVTP